ncbi:MAG: peroxide stress protein YaaA [Parabacteroides sp.]|nr:peroxide stress protein YaaA [Parabacteroides sp.]
MHILLSPAKTITGTSKIKVPSGTIPQFQQAATDIALYMAQYSVEDLKRLLKLSPKLALESYERFQHFHSTDKRPLQALLAYTGVVFKHINPKDFSEEDFLFAQTHLRIVSICYGLLRPLDLIKPYRMEYDIKLPELGDGNMYNFWKGRQTQSLIKEVKADDNLLINLASMDVQPAFEWKKIEESVRIITPEFKVWKNGKAETIVIYAKMARGQMSRYIIKNKISNPEELKSFTWEGFQYKETLSSENNWVFLQD